jgi:anti-sigma regulatory factor (Ser/Thr protein kinase)
MYRRAVAEDLSDVGVAIAWADGLAAEHGMSDDVRYAIQLCLEEALSNLILHAKTSGGPKDIEIAFAPDAPYATVTVTDACMAFDPTGPLPKGDPAAIGGQGLRLMQTFAATLSYRRVDARNELVLRLGPQAT